MNNFKSKNLFSIGVEEEYMICDPTSYELIDKANEIINSLNVNEKDFFSYELLLSEIEANTPICKDSNIAIHEVVKMRNKLKTIGEKLNYKIGISGTHPTSKPKDQTFVDNQAYNWVSNQLKYYAKQNMTFSTHIHIGLDDPDAAIYILNQARAWISPLLSLTVNSPFFSGENTGMKSSRIFQFGIFPRTNVLHTINNVEEYLKIVENLKLSKSIEKERHLWWKIRPHFEYGTIEFRICDIQRSLKRTHMIIILTQAIVRQIYTDYKNNKPLYSYNIEFINDSIWKASRYGLDCKIVCPITEKPISMKKMVDSMLQYIHPSLLYFGTDFVIEIVKDIINTKTEADLQIDIFNRFGFNELNKYLIEEVEYTL